MAVDSASVATPVARHADLSETGGFAAALEGERAVLARALGDCRAVVAGGAGHSAQRRVVGRLDVGDRVAATVAAPQGADRWVASGEGELR